MEIAIQVALTKHILARVLSSGGGRGGGGGGGASLKNCQMIEIFLSQYFLLGQFLCYCTVLYIPTHLGGWGWNIEYDFAGGGCGREMSPLRGAQRLNLKRSFPVLELSENSEILQSYNYISRTAIT